MGKFKMSKSFLPETWLSIFEKREKPILEAHAKQFSILFPSRSDGISMVALLSKKWRKYARLAYYANGDALETVPLKIIQSSIINHRSNPENIFELWKTLGSNHSKGAIVFTINNYIKNNNVKSSYFIKQNNQEMPEHQLINEISKVLVYENYDYDFSKECSVVILSNNYKSVLNQIKLLKTIKSPIIFCLDVTDEEYKILQRNLNNDKINLYRGRSMRDRYYISIKKVKTPYVVYIGDDDFIMPKFISRAVQVLFDNEMVFSVEGLGIDYGLVSRGHIHGAMALRRVSDSLVAETPEGRMIDASVVPGTRINAVMRTSALEHIFCLASEFKINDRFHEALWATCIVIAGKSVQIDEMSLLRRRTKESATYKVKPFIQLLIDSTPDMANLVFLSSIEFSKIIKKNIDENQISLFISNYFIQSMANNNFNSPFNQLNIKSILKNFDCMKFPNLTEEEELFLSLYIKYLYISEEH